MGVRLPAEYQEVEYLESTGTQYINTWIVGRDSIYAESRLMFTQTNLGNAGFLGTRQGGGDQRFYLISVWQGVWQLGLGEDFFSTTAVLPNTLYDIKVGRDWNTYRFALNVNGADILSGSSRIQSTYDMYVFAVNNYGTASRFCSARLYLLKISNDNSLLRDYIPCYRKSDNKPGMYDLVSDEFFTNAGTGEFLVGPDVIDSISPMMVAWRRMLMRKPSPVPTGYVTDGLVLWLDGINKGNTPNAWDDLISGYSFEDYYGQVVFGSDYVEFADNKECYLYNQDFDVPRYTDGTIEIVYETNIAHAQILFSPKSKLSIAYGVGAGSVIWVKNVGSGTRPNMYKYPRFTSGSVSISLNSAYYDGAVQQNTGIDIWADDDRASTVIGKTYYRDDRCFGGKIYCIRIYNRQLTEAEVLANYAVDRSRFSLFN